MYDSIKYPFATARTKNLCWVTSITIICAVHSPHKGDAVGVIYELRVCRCHVHLLCNALSLSLSLFLLHVMCHLGIFSLFHLLSLSLSGK